MNPPPPPLDLAALDLVERQRVKPLARRILDALRIGSRDQIDVLHAEVKAAGYLWGDLFLQVIDLGWRYEAHQEQKNAARVGELRADLRAFVTDDACLDDDD